MEPKIFNSCVLLILDGWGDTASSKFNAITLANTPNLDYLYKHSYHTLLEASGNAVGLPEGIIGSSEVGHLNIGAGKVVLQEVLKINNDIKDGKFFSNKVFIDAIKHANEKGKAIHLIGLASNALVHSSIEHLFALIKLCAENDMKEVYIHAITDGRDTNVDESFNFISQISEITKMYGVGSISTISGRYYAMDRDQRWDRTQKAYNAFIQEKNDTPEFENALGGIQQSYSNGITDEFIIPFRIKGKRLIEDDDSVIFFNFREDRAKQLTQAFLQEDFNHFSRKKINTLFVTMTEYENGLCANIAYEKDNVNSPISFVLSERNLAQFKIAETEKYPHVTYFFNGGRDTPFPLEDRYLIPSLKISTYDLNPSMRAKEISNELISRIKSHKYKLLVANFANADMVGHTGNLQATIKACECIDECLGEILKTMFEENILLVITADHGNAEVKYNPITKEISTSHTTNPVPFILSFKGMEKDIKITNGKLADIAPTILNRLGLDRSFDMSGNDLLI